jgi:hypothetical protein
MTVIPSQGVDNVAIRKVSEELVLVMNPGLMVADVVLRQHSLVCVDKFAEVATQRTELADFSDGKLLDNVRK